MKLISFLTILFFYTPVLAGQFPVGEFELSFCTRTEYTEKLPWLRIPVIKQSRQILRIYAFIDGPDIDLPKNREVINLCIRETLSSIGLSVIAADNTGGSTLFKDIFIKCLQSNAPQLEVSSVFLKSESTCGW